MFWINLILLHYLGGKGQKSFQENHQHKNIKFNHIKLLIFDQFLSETAISYVSTSTVIGLNDFSLWRSRTVLHDYLPIKMSSLKKIMRQLVHLGSLFVDSWRLLENFNMLHNLFWKKKSPKQPINQSTKQTTSPISLK